MRDFLIKSKDMYFEHPQKFDYFKTVFDSIEEMNASKNYYATNLFNIEEILSIIEMKAALENEKMKKEFLNYIKSVILHYTPLIKPPSKLSNSSNAVAVAKALFGSNYLLLRYGILAGNFLNLLQDRQAVGSITLKSASTPQTRYSIVTLNYDTILEKICKCLKECRADKDELKFKDSNEEYDPDWSTPHIAKLHGSVDSGIIVPPTWSKGVHDDIVKDWKLAYHLLLNANYIRFVGYSLSTTDAYIKYLLISSVLKSPHLKGIDVLCLDTDGSIKKRYDELIKFNEYRFVNADFKDYLLELYQLTAYDKNIYGKNVSSRTYLDFDQLENAHAVFFKQHTKKSK